MNLSRHGKSAESGSNTPVWRCRICHNVVPIETAKTDGDGRPVHEECYFLEVNQDRSITGHVNGHVKEEKRSWSAIAKELAQEQDSDKVGQLAEELNKALDQAEAERHPPIQRKPDGSD